MGGFLGLKPLEASPLTGDRLWDSLISSRDKFSRKAQHGKHPECFAHRAGPQVFSIETPSTADLGVPAQAFSLSACPWRLRSPIEPVWHQLIGSPSRGFFRSKSCITRTMR